MPRFSKWLINVAPDAPVDRVARRAIAARLRAVAWFFQAAAEGDQQAEDIHQLRIWTRRAAAGLRLFAPTLEGKPAKRLKRTLRELRRTAGSVRDCDVHLESLHDADPPRHLIRKLKKQRQRARKDLQAVFRRYARKRRLERQVAAALKAIAWPKRHSSRAAPSFAPWCRQQLAPLAVEFFELASAEHRDDSQIHELRLAGKRLRYALELSPAALPPRRHRRLYEELSSLQDRLGAICDSLAAIARIRDWQSSAKKRKHREQFASLLGREEQRLAARRRQFHRWWSAARRARFSQHWQQAVPLDPVAHFQNSHTK
jgi:CHAD domain-containing protein